MLLLFCKSSTVLGFSLQLYSISHLHEILLMGELLKQNFIEIFILVVGSFYHLIRINLLHKKHINRTHFLDGPNS